ncbi:tumor necrosis factor receptor superfamily member 6B [Echinops telfairi]|uniref:Tumor necrosis factor receptor superfamily member 6B n=1 Tax=Echinops telfairi TaxID=9371 RepID=A0AC55DM83_ECHTE|nr:tumor necrosis factor receptor superfamily member 6B [Echinops telfairi]
MRVAGWTGRTLLWVLPALLITLAVHGAVTVAPTFPWRDEETQELLVCDQCPPGTFVQWPCRRDSPTDCVACPSRHYTQFWNYLGRCRYCNVVCGEREEEVQPCSTTRNRACRCRAGFFAHAGFCLEHAQCPPGAGVVAPGTPSQNTECQSCLPGSFSAGSSSSERCQPHRNCSALGLTLNVPGSAFHDALCTSCPRLGLSAPDSQECERALLDFVAFQDISFKRLMRLQQALAALGARRRQVSREEGRAASQLKLRRQLAELGAGDGALGARLLWVLRAARLAGLERSVRSRFFPVP